MKREMRDELVLDRRASFFLSRLKKGFFICFLSKTGLSNLFFYYLDGEEVSSIPGQIKSCMKIMICILAYMA